MEEVMSTEELMFKLAEDVAHIRAKLNTIVTVMWLAIMFSILASCAAMFM